jgi:hypothetical protein
MVIERELIHRLYPMVTATVTATSGDVNLGDDGTSDVCLLVGAVPAGLGGVIGTRLLRAWVAGRDWG